MTILFVKTWTLYHCPGASQASDRLGLTRTWERAKQAIDQDVYLMAKFSGRPPTAILEFAGLHLGPPTLTRAKSGREDWIPLSAIPPPWLPIRTYARGNEAEWPELSLPGSAMLRPGLFEQNLNRVLFMSWGTCGSGGCCRPGRAQGAGGALVWPPGSSFRVACQGVGR